MIHDVLDRRYEILERVGGGGMAEVYRARDQLLDRFVAVKVLHTQFSNDEEFVRKFRREAQGAAKLSHPNIVNIYDVGKEENKHYIIMEYVSGETLKEKIQREGVLSQEEALSIAREIAEALEHAHRNDLVHCDIKPHNILVTEEGRIKVTDFGIARAVSSATMTYSGNVVGSVHYFSPEQAKGGAVSAKSDIYSLGVVLYEMLAGTLPFTGETPIGVALKHLQETPRTVREIRPETAPLVEAIVLKAMAKEPEDRFASVAEMIADIKAAESALSGGKSATSAQDEFSTQVLPKIETPPALQKEKAAPARALPAKSKRTRNIFIALALILAAGFLVGAALSYGKFWSGNEVSVPDVLGKQSAAAKDILEAEKLRVNIAEAYDGDAPAGQVVSQYPEAGAIVKEKRLVTIYVSKGGEAVDTPDLRGLSRRDAELKLKNAGLALGKIDEQFSDQAFETVLNQSPRQGAKVVKGYGVDLVISKGPQSRKLSLPDFKGSPLGTINTQLESLKLKLGKVTELEDAKNPSGTIIEQNPAGGSEVLEGTSIDFTVAKEAKSQTKRTAVELTVPEEGTAKQAVRIVVTDVNGRRTVYESVHKAGDKINKTIEGSGELRVQVYINGKLAQEKNI